MKREGARGAAVHHQRPQAPLARSRQGPTFCVWIGGGCAVAEHAFIGLGASPESLAPTDIGRPRYRYKQRIEAQGLQAMGPASQPRPVQAAVAQVGSPLALDMEVGKLGVS